MTTTQKPAERMSKVARDAIVDKLRSCQTTEEILSFEQWFDNEAHSGPLHTVICDFLRNRTISRVLAAKWLGVLISDRDYRLRNPIN